MSSAGALAAGKSDTLTLPFSAFVPDGDTRTFAYSASNGALNGAGTTMGFYAPILLPIGKRITAIRVYIKDSATGPTKLQATLTSIGVTNGSGATAATSSVSAGDGSEQTLQMTSLTQLVVSNKSYSLAVNTTTGTASCNVHMAEIDYDDGP